MARIVIALGSVRAPKKRALAAVLQSLSPELAAAEIRALDVESGVAETPVGRSELIGGAGHRVEQLRTLVPEAKFWVGMEGGLNVHVAGAWLENWACVSDGVRTFWGSGGSLPVPEHIRDAVVDKHRSLSGVMDEIAGQPGIRDREGAWGVLTEGRVSREDVFRLALMNAFTPFFSSRY